MLNEIRKQETGESIRVYIHKFSKSTIKQHKRLASKDLELTTKVNFLSKLQNPRIANKVAQSKEFQNFYQFSLQHCFKKALELEGTHQVSEGVNMVRPTNVLHMYHEEDDDEICQLNQINRDNKVRNNACWKCGEVGHFAQQCPLNVKDGKLQDKYTGQVQHTYTGSTPVTEKMWHDLMKRAISATANNVALANKYKQMKNKVQVQAASSNVTTTTSSIPTATQKQYTTTPKTTVTTSAQTSVMKSVGTSASQSSNKNQNWRGSGIKPPQQIQVLVPVP